MPGLPRLLTALDIHALVRDHPKHSVAGGAGEAAPQRRGYRRFASALRRSS